MVKLLSQRLPEGALQGQADVEQLISELQQKAQILGVQMQHNVEVQNSSVQCFSFVKTVCLAELVKSVNH